MRFIIAVVHDGDDKTTDAIRETRGVLGLTFHQCEIEDLEESTRIGDALDFRTLVDEAMDDVRRNTEEAVKDANDLMNY